ncbi:MAG TPA: 2-dehydropantoate 2-reductase N-terminal domain-containing protein, partial [Stellaceae bacterium]|nr:2-dehydropantoate 2-reductase N-terminal domain-containing protein [Stellaceae bacterium]
NHSLTFVDRAEDHVAAINRSGLAITGPVAEFKVSAPALLPSQVTGTYGTVLLCVKAQDTAEAARAIKPHLAADGCIVSVQNGLNELVIADIVGEPRTVGAFVNFGADYLSPGTILYGGRGAVVVGEIDGRRTPRVEALHQLLLEFDDRAVLTGNIWGYLWAKLAYGAMLFATALTDASIADCLASERHRALFVALPQEVLRIAVAAGIKPEPFDGFDPAAFMPGASAAAARQSLDALVEHNRRSAKSHSGIWRDLAVRKRKTEAEHQLGPIVEAARRHGLAAPITAQTIALIREIEDGGRKLEWAGLDLLSHRVPA